MPGTPSTGELCNSCIGHLVNRRDLSVHVDKQNHPPANMLGSIHDLWKPEISNSVSQHFF
jgi:hypothetical protein